MSKDYEKKYSRMREDYNTVKESMMRNGISVPRNNNNAGRSASGYNNNRPYSRTRTDGDQPATLYDPPASQINDFVEMLTAIATTLSNDEVTVVVKSGLKKAESGIAYASVSIVKNGMDEAAAANVTPSVYVYYDEDTFAPGKKFTRVPALRQHVLIAATNTGAPLFVKAGNNILEKVRGYAEGIIAKNIAAMSGVRPDAK